MNEQLEIRLERILPGSIVWDPRPDISTLELALALNVLLNLNLQHARGAGAGILANMPERVKRHFIYKVEP